MAWKRDKLTDLTIRSAKSTERLRKLSDGRGLQLWITPQGGRYWRLEYRRLGRRKLLAIGTYPDVSLEKARKAADNARSQIADGQDPSEIKRQKKVAQRFAADNTFEKVANRLIAKKQKAGRSPVTIAKMQWILGKLASSLGPRSLESIRTPDVIQVLRREEEADNLETARRMRTVIGEVFRYGMQNGIVESDPSAATRGAIASPRAKHYAAITDPHRFAELLRLIDAYAGRHPVVGGALQLMALLYPRPGELRQAQWTEFDLENSLWEVPAARMKLRQPHTKPLSRQAVAVLGRLQKITGPQGFVFPATGRSNRPLSENTMNAALRRMGIAASEHSSHGFRATASTLLNASNLFSVDAIERSLAHQDKDAVRRAYARGDALTGRRKMAQWWADHMDALRSGRSADVVTLGRRSARSH